MTLAEAIEYLSEHSNLILVDKNPNLKKAMKLCLEASRRIQTFRDRKYYYARSLLPGETHD